MGRSCLDALRRRTVRPEQPLDHLTPSAARGREPEDEAVLADAVGVPFDEVAEVLDRSPVAARQLASRARRRVQGAPSSATTAADAGRHGGVVRAFLRAARDDDLPGLVAVLDPDVVLRADGDVAELGGVRRSSTASPAPCSGRTGCCGARSSWSSRAATSSPSTS